MTWECAVQRTILLYPTCARLMLDVSSDRILKLVTLINITVSNQLEYIHRIAYIQQYTFDIGHGTASVAPAQAERETITETSGPTGSCSTSTVFDQTMLYGR